MKMEVGMWSLKSALKCFYGGPCRRQKRMPNFEGERLIKEVMKEVDKGTWEVGMNPTTPKHKPIPSLGATSSSYPSNNLKINHL